MKFFSNTFFLSALSIAVAASSASAATVYSTTLGGTNEVPANNSPGTGTATVSLSGDTLTVNLSFSGLTAPATMGHIHCCGPIGVNEPVALPFSGLPSGTSATYSGTFDLTSSSVYTAAFITASGGTTAGAEAALIAGLNSGYTYANVHDANFPGGEIEGQLAAVPEPATLLFGLLGLPFVALARRRAVKNR